VSRKGLANNHKICNASFWTRYGTDDFLESDRTGWGSLKGLDPDG